MCNCHLKPATSSYFKSLDFQVVKAAPQELKTPNSSTVSKEVHSPPSESKKAADPFLYYSNDKIRMNELQLKDTCIGTAIDEQTSRKTRLSFELHPYMFFEDFLDDSDDEDVDDDDEIWYGYRFED